ncbi:MAG: YcaO-like family protein [Pseudomonadota bacterium]
MTISFDGLNEKQLEYGSHRVLPAAQTLAKIEPLKQRFGITRLANVTGLDSIGIPVTLAIRPNSRSVAVSQGKGVTLAQAKVSALMEAIEIWHAENFSGQVLFGKQKDIKLSSPTIQTNRLPPVKGKTFDHNTPMLWVNGKDLISGREVLIPYEMVHADYTRPVQPAHGYFPASTNGLASGNTKLEAVCHAIAEVVERDALSLWHASISNQNTMRRINLQSIENQECMQLIEAYAKSNLDCGVWDITSDTGLATILCLVRENKSNTGHIGLGSGCHVDHHIALRRALTEAAQTRLNYISGARDDLGLSEYDAEGLDGKYAFADMLFTAKSESISISDVPSQSFPTLSDDLEHMINQLKKVSVEEIGWVDLTRQEYGIAVARVIIPGLEAPHDDAAYTPGPRAKQIGEL